MEKKVGREKILELNANRTPEQHFKDSQKGGLKGSETRRRKKLIKEQMSLLLGLPVKSEKARRQLESIGIQEEEMNNQMAMVLALWNKVVTTGDVSAFNSIRDLMGEKPVDVQQIQSIPVIKDDIE